MSRYSDEDDFHTRSPRSEIRRGIKFFSSHSPSLIPRARRRSSEELAMANLGSGGAALERDRDPSRGGRQRRERSYHSSRSSSRSRNRGGKDTKEQLVQSTKAALLAGAGEAFRSRKERGSPRRKRVLTAAVSAGAINALLNSGNNDEHGGNKRKVAKSVVGGLAVNYLVNGSRHKNTSRSRSHSRGRRDDKDRNGEGRHITGLSVNGNKSRAESRRNSISESDSDGEQGKRSTKSMGNLARAGMAKLGLGGNKSGLDTVSRSDT